MRIGKLFLVLVGSSLLLTFCNNKVDGDMNVDQQNEEQSPTEVNVSVNQDVKPEENLSGEVIIINEEEFVKLVTDIDNPKGFHYKGNTPCIVDFYADWCRPCVALTPVLKELAKEYKGKVIFYKINVDKSAEVSRVFEVTSIPTLIFFKPNSIPSKMVGAPSKEELKSTIDENFLAK